MLGKFFGVTGAEDFGLFCAARDLQHVLPSSYRGKNASLQSSFQAPKALSAANEKAQVRADAL